MGRGRCFSLYLIATLIFSATCAHSQWIAWLLHPQGSTRTITISTDGKEMVGFMWPPLAGRALYWNGLVQPIDLTPLGAIGAQAWGVENGKQVGFVEYQSARYASLWSGTPESLVNLNPNGAAGSTANRIRNGVIAGGAYVNGVSGAGVWTSPDAESWVDLHPPAYTTSYAVDTDGIYQVGYTNHESIFKAAFWEGTRESFVDIHPAGRHESRAIAISSGQIGGYSTFNTARDAALWSIPTFAFTNLHPYNTEPFGYSSSEVWAMAEGIQVGYYARFGVSKVCLWEGTSGSWFSLNDFLPPGANYSKARGVSMDDEYVYIVGETEMPGTGLQGFMMRAKRTYQVMPTSVSVAPGILVSGNAQALSLSDDVVLQGRPGPVLSTLTAPFQLTVESQCPIQAPSSMEFVLESRATAAGMQIQIAFYNFQTGAYELISTGESFGGDRTMNAYMGAQAQRFVEMGTRKIRAKVSYKASGPVLSYPWVATIDRGVFKFPLVN